MARPSYCCLAVFLLSSLTLCFAATLGTPAEVTQENQRKLAKANNELALNLLRQVAAGSSENVFFSPLGLSSAFGMLYYGAKGQTAKELRQAVGYETANLPDELVHQTFQQYLTEYLPSQDSSAYVLKSANAILLDKYLKLVPTYKNEVQRLYQASVESLDFAHEAAQVVDKVNDWVKEKTNGKIDKLLDDLNPSTVVVLLNAIYFKGAWETEFNTSLTRPGTFYNNGLVAEAKDVPLMSMTNHFAYADIDNFQAVELPYRGENISMVILLPNERNVLESLVKSLTLERLEIVRQQMYQTKVELTIPKFKSEYKRDMSVDFQALGAKHVFQPGADLSGLATGNNVFVSQVHHKAVVEVNEGGSEAAAVTGVFIDATRRISYPPPNFIADHPFLFAIVDQRSDMILFLGTVTNL